MGCSIPRAERSRSPHQFVGYWGYGNAVELAAEIDRSLQQTSGTVQMQRSPVQPDQPIWRVAFVGLDRLPDPQPYLAALSAAELPSPDAWVKLLGCDRLILGREPFGRVPLYWMQIGRVLWFASRLPLLLPLISQPQVSIPALYGYSCFPMFRHR